LSGALIALISALLWAMASVLLAFGAKKIDVVPLNLLRCTMSTIFFWVLLPFYGGLPAIAAIPSSAWLWLVVSVLALLVIGDTLYFRSMDLAGVSWAMPVASITPLWVVVLASIFVGEPLTLRLVAGALLVILGVILVSRSQNPEDPVERADTGARRRGLLLALVVSLLWSVGQVALKPGTAGMHSVVANSVRQPMGLIMMLGLTLYQGRWKDLKRLDRRSWVAIAFAGLVGTGLGTLLFIMAIQIVGAGPTAILTSTTPLMAIPFSVLWLQERPTRWTLAGTLLTTGGIALVA
jgi:uncharacterized membrane protein